MKLYIVDYWVPFPRSEYGGLQTIVADNDEEVFNFIFQDSYYDLQSFPEHKDLIDHCIAKAEVFELNPAFSYVKGIRASFIT